MQILVVGGGGREHTLVWKLAQSRHVHRIFCAPGNAGIARQAECINLRPTDLDGLANFAESQKIDLTVVGPEAPLIAGIVDRFEARGLPIFGPATDPAQLEGSKVFSKDLMAKYGIPTAAYAVFTQPTEAHSYVTAHFASTAGASPIVIKADGLAAGKGVIVAKEPDEAHAAIDSIMLDRVFGAAGDRLLVEECLVGEEVSVMAFTDGETVVPMVPAQDHKRVFDNDEGPNTGGMGAYSPVPSAGPELVAETVDRVLKPAISAIRDLGIPYKGVLYAGIMMTPSGIQTLEFNCRFGDPETQVVLPLLETDLVEVLDACVNCSLADIEVRWSHDAAMCVVGASGGYPGSYDTGKVISGLDRAAQCEGAIVLHSGTRESSGDTVTDGGRVLGITGVGHDLPEAAARAYAAMSQIHFDGLHYRRDIGSRALRR